MYKCIIGIDPDVGKSGVAFLETDTKRLEITSLTFPLLIDYLKQEKSNADKSGCSIVVVVEAGWLIHSNWHLKNGDNKRIAAAKGNSAGRNHEVGRKIVECARHYGLEVVEQCPLKKRWKGKDGKITHGELSRIEEITVPARTNQEERDAALLAIVHSGMPIRMRR